MLDSASFIAFAGLTIGMVIAMMSDNIIFKKFIKSRRISESQDRNIFFLYMAIVFLAASIIGWLKIPIGRFEPYDRTTYLTGNLTLGYYFFWGIFLLILSVVSIIYGKAPLKKKEKSFILEKSYFLSKPGAEDIVIKAIDDYRSREKAQALISERKLIPGEYRVEKNLTYVPGKEPEKEERALIFSSL